MHAFLFVGGTNKTREEEMIDAAQEYGSVYEFPLQKIADMRDLAYFTKFSQAQNTAIVIKDIDSATKESLNAFLKILEEPGKNISYFLSCQNEQNLLSTITSRCQIKRLSQRPSGENSDIASEFLELSFGEKIKILEKIKKRDEAIEYLKDLTLSAHEKMLEGKDNQEVVLTKTTQKVIYNLNLNANVNLQMTNFAIKSAKSVFTKDG